MRRWLVLVLSAAASGALAAPFADPTRPPGAIEGERAAAAGGPRLESVLIAPDRRIAVINGQEVTIGSRFGDGEVVRITEDEVLIRKADGEASLKLFPGEARRPAATPKGR